MTLTLARDSLLAMADHPWLAQHAVLVSYHSCGRYALEGMVYGAVGWVGYEPLVREMSLSPMLPKCVQRADNTVRFSVIELWDINAARRRFLRRYRELTWSLTLWDRIVIRVREALGLRGCA